LGFGSAQVFPCPRESASVPEAQSERTIQIQATTHVERAKLGVLLEMGSDFFKQTPPHIKHRTGSKATFPAFGIITKGAKISRKPLLDLEFLSILPPP